MSVLGYVVWGVLTVLIGYALNRVWDRIEARIDRK